MERIYKYVITRVGVNQLLVPKGAKLLSCKAQDEKICLWFLVDPLASKRDVRLFTCIMTGERIEILAKKEFIDTCLIDGGSFVLHVFEIL